MRFIFTYFPWLFCILTLGFIDVEVKYSDGSKFKWVGWITRFRGGNKMYRIKYNFLEREHRTIIIACNPQCAIKKLQKRYFSCIDILSIEEIGGNK